MKLLDFDLEFTRDHDGLVTVLLFQGIVSRLSLRLTSWNTYITKLLLKAIERFSMLAGRGLFIGLPDIGMIWRCAGYILNVGITNWVMPCPFVKLNQNEFDGKHHWKMNELGHPLERTLSHFKKENSLMKFCRVKESPYYRFFLISPK